MAKRVRDVIVVVQLVGHRWMPVAFMTIRAIGLGHRGDLPQVLVGDFLLRVGQLQEALPCLVILAFSQRDAQPVQPVMERVAPRPRGQHDA